VRCVVVVVIIIIIIIYYVFFPNFLLVRVLLWERKQQSLCWVDKSGRVNRSKT